MTNKTQIYHDLKRKKASLQHCIKAIAGKVVKLRSVHLINFCGGGKVIALKSATALILDRCATVKKYTQKLNGRIKFVTLILWR